MFFSLLATNWIYQSPSEELASAINHLRIKLPVTIEFRKEYAYRQQNGSSKISILRGHVVYYGSDRYTKELVSTVRHPGGPIWKIDTEGAQQRAFDSTGKEVDERMYNALGIPGADEVVSCLERGGESFAYSKFAFGQTVSWQGRAVKEILMRTQTGSKERRSYYIDRKSGDFIGYEIANVTKANGNKPGGASRHTLVFTAVRH